MSFKDDSTITLVTSAKLSEPEVSAIGSAPRSDPQPPEPPPEEPTPVEPDPYPDFRDVPPVCPIDQADV
jgi:hypothetical protein